MNAEGGRQRKAGGWAWRAAAQALFYVALPVLLVTTSVRIAFSEERVYQYSIDHYDVATVTGISHADLIAATQDLRAYFTDDEAYLRTRVHDANGNVVPLFNTREVLHMRDVKQLVHFFYALQVITLGIVATYIAAVCLWGSEESLAQLARRAVQAVIGMAAALLLFSAVATVGGFDSLFVQFHQLLFNNNYWQLDPSRDHLVQMFPEGFWLDATVIVGGLIVLQGLLIGGGSLLYLRRHRSVAASPAPPTATPDADEIPDVAPEELIQPVAKA